MMMAAGFESGSDMTADIEEQLKAQLPPEMISEDMTVLDILKMMPQEQKQAFVSEIEKKTEELPDTITEQAAVNYVKEAYADLGIDMDELQFRYLFSTGAKMIGLAFLGMAASVLVGFLASRVGAAAGRDLRGRVFKKVVGYSSNEFDRFFHGVFDHEKYKRYPTSTVYYRDAASELYFMRRFLRSEALCRYFRQMFQCPGSSVWQLF